VGVMGERHTECLPFAHRKPVGRFSPRLQGRRLTRRAPCRKLLSVVPRRMPANRLPISSCDALNELSVSHFSLFPSLFSSRELDGFEVFQRYSTVGT